MPRVIWLQSWWLVHYSILSQTPTLFMLYSIGKINLDSGSKIIHQGSNSESELVWAF